MTTTMPGRSSHTKRPRPEARDLCSIYFRISLAVHEVAISVPTGYVGVFSLLSADRGFDQSDLASPILTGSDRV